MDDGGPRRLGPVWVWLLGVVVLIIALLLLIDWVSGRDEEAAVTDVSPTSEAVAGLATPEERAAAIVEVERAGVPVPLGAVLPLGPADTGVLVDFDGEIVGQPIEEGVWVLNDDGSVIFVRIVDLEDVDGLEAGERLGGRAVVRHDPGQVEQWTSWGELAPRERSARVEGYYLETTVDRIGGRLGERDA